MRAAIEEGNATNGTHTINFSTTVFASGNFTIAQVEEQYTLTKSFTINGPTSATVSIWPVFSGTEEGVDSFRILEVQATSTSTIKNLRLVGGWEQNDNGGGILNGGLLTLDGVTISSCAAVNGGGIANVSEMWLINSTIIYCEALSDGGGISTAASSTSKTHLVDSTLSGNSAGNPNNAGKGGGISLLQNASLSVSGGGITGNTASNGGIGGGIYTSGGVITLNGCTLSSNSANNGGGLYSAGGGSVANLNEVAVSANSADSWGGGFFSQGQRA